MSYTFTDARRASVLTVRPLAAAAMLCAAGAACADDAIDSPQTMPTVVVQAIQDSGRSPATTESVSAQQLAETSNVMNVEDTLKYLPGILVRKRFDGDTQAPVATRTTGINASARSLVFVDGVLLSALVNNNNANGSPRWFMVSPEEVDSVDVMYGPFSAAYAGNSYGAVIKFTTRMPRQLEATVKTTLASQQSGQSGGSDHFHTGSLNATIGNRSGALAWFVSANHLDSNGQPISIGTLAQSSRTALATDPVIVNAGADRNRTGDAILVIGAGTIVHTVQDTAKLKLTYDIAPGVTGSYLLGYWQNSATAFAQSYLKDANGAPYFGASGGNVNIGGRSYSASAVTGQFSSSSNAQQHWMQSLGLRAVTGDAWDWDAVVSNYRYATDLTRTSTGVYPAAQTGGAGRIADAGGTSWSTFDLTGTWHPQYAAGVHLVAVGLHGDRITLVSPTYNTANWANGDAGALFSDSRGKTQTTALWLQDVWRLAPAWTATLGARYERWRASDGYNYALATSGAGFAVTQPTVAQAGLSPKATLAWKAGEQWMLTASFGKALRFPTVGELYQNVQTGATFTQANPFLRPENVKSGELAFERAGSDGSLRVSLFEERVRDALISQTSNLAGFAAPVSFTQNVDLTRQRGIELVAQQRDGLVRGLELNGSVTYVDARILANSGYVATIAGASSVGKHTPYVPDWRATGSATWRPADKLALTLSARYSARQYATVDNTDINTHTYQGFDGYFVMDARLHYQFDRQWSAALGVDNLNNRSYFLFHPFPQRTLVAELKFSY